jgi:hypothetical protein
MTTEIVLLTFKDRELMDKTLRRWRKVKGKINKQFPKFAKPPMEDVYGFAYWLFRHSGLKVNDNDKASMP